MSSAQLRWLKRVIVVAVSLALLSVVWAVYSAGQVLLAACFLAGFTLAVYTFSAPRAYTWRYLFPGVAGMALFVVFPLLYTIGIGFTNYSSQNLLTFERATAYLLAERQAGEGTRYAFTLHADGDRFRLVMEPKVEAPAAEEGQEAPAAEGGEQAAPAAPPTVYVTAPFALGRPVEVAAAPLAPGAERPGAPLQLKALIQHQKALQQVQVKLPDGTEVRPLGLRELGTVQPTWARNADGSLTQAGTGQVIRPNFKTGFYETEQGERLRPGFKVNIGLGNYARMATDPEFRGPFLAIFAWTVAFAGLTVLFTLCVGMVLAVVLNWEALRFRGLYRTLLFLPYAVPGFISILVFRGLFNQSFGELNLILNQLFGVKPSWFADPTLAKVMLLIVNTWLGYPYILVLCTGLIKAIPSDLYEASALEGAGALANFFKITAPLILRPLTPLLIASFAFNFNNYALISLLTRGRPDFLGTRVPAGTTDILVTYLNRIAFEDSGQQFGLAAAISTVIFVLVAALSIVNLKITKAQAEEARA